jgi:hypothetical protein
MYDFDGSTNSSTLKYLANVELEKMMNSVRPMSMANKPTNDPTFRTPHKDNNLIYFSPNSSLERHNDNKYKEIPHIDFLPIYTRPYYSVNETGWTNFRYEDMWRI